MSQSVVALPQSVVDDGGIGTIAWVDPQNVEVDDDSYAGIGVQDGTSHYLKASNFNFNLPSNAVIEGITVIIKRNTNASTLDNHVVDNVVSLMKAGVVQSDNEAEVDYWPYSISIPKYGSKTSLWGETWNPSDINNTGFGVVFSANITNNYLTLVSVFYIKVQIDYSTPPIASFTVSDNNPPFNRKIQFTDSSTGEPTSWFWDFGDGETSSEQNPTHSFSSVDSYNVTLTATNALGSSETSSSIVTREYKIDRSKLDFYSEDSIDQIIGITSGTISVAAPSASDGYKTASQSFAHQFGDSAYFRGVFSVDGGTTWNDFGSQTPDTSGTYPVFQTCDCNAYVDSTNLVVTATSYYNNVSGKGKSYTVNYKVFLLAKNSMSSPITPISVSPNFLLTSEYNYQKIAFRGSIPLSVSSGSTGSVSVTHGLGYIPKVRAWWFDSASPNTCRPLSSGFIYDPQVRIDTNKVTFYVDASYFVDPSVSGTIQYRIYYD